MATIWRGPVFVNRRNIPPGWQPAVAAALNLTIGFVAALPVGAETLPQQSQHPSAWRLNQDTTAESPRALLSAVLPAPFVNPVQQAPEFRRTRLPANTSSGTNLPLFTIRLPPGAQAITSAPPRPADHTGGGSLGLVYLLPPAPLPPGGSAYFNPLRFWWQPQDVSGNQTLLLPPGAPPPPPPPPDVQPTGGGGYIHAHKRERYGLIPPRTKEELAALVKAQREALGILPKPAQKRIVIAAKKAVSKSRPIEDLVEVVVDVALSTDAPAAAVADALAAVFAYRQALAQADASIERAEQEKRIAIQAAERAEQEAIEAERARKMHVAMLIRDDAQLLAMSAEIQRLIALGLRDVQRALMDFVQDSGIAAPE